MNLGFYKRESIRGFSCFLMVVESRTSYRWAYLRRNKKPPIKLIVWFMKYLRRFLDSQSASSGQMEVVNHGEAYD
jgi:hypothetical protein